MPSLSIGGRPLCNLRFADDIDLGDSEEELQQERLDKTAADYGMEISSEKSKIDSRQQHQAKAIH